MWWVVWTQAINQQEHQQQHWAVGRLMMMMKCQRQHPSSSRVDSAVWGRGLAQNAPNFQMRDIESACSAQSVPHRHARMWPPIIIIIIGVDAPISRAVQRPEEMSRRKRGGGGGGSGRQKTKLVLRTVSLFTRLFLRPSSGSGFIQS